MPNNSSFYSNFQTLFYGSVYRISHYTSVFRGMKGILLIIVGEKIAVYSKAFTSQSKEAFLNSNGEHYITKRQPFLRSFIQIELLSIWNNISAKNSCIVSLFTNSSLYILWAPTFVLFMVVHWLILFHRTTNLLLPKANSGFCKYIFSYIFHEVQNHT